MGILLYTYSMTDHFYQLRQCSLDPKLQAQLAPFINAHRPFDGIECTWQELKKEGLIAIDHVTTGMEEITEDVTLTTGYFYCPVTEQFYPRPDIKSDWLTTKINHWKSETAAKTSTQ